MPPRNWKLRIDDILQAIARIRRYTKDMTFEAFSADERTVDAVARNFTIIGEAARHVPSSVQARYPQLPWREMRGLRNVAAHEYFRLSMSVLWDTVTQDLPPLVPQLQEILERER